MIDPGKLAAFAVLTAVTSVVPGPNMMFVMTQSVWRGSRGGLAALAGLEAGNLVWFVLAGLGLGALMQAAPLAFAGLTLAGALYLAWLGAKALRNAAYPAQTAPKAASRPAAHAMRDGFAVAVGNPKSLVYVTALLPPFVDMSQPMAMQLVVLAAVALSLDVVVSLAYIFAGNRLNAAISRPQVHRRLDLAVGTLFLLISAAVLWQSAPALRSALLAS